MSELTDTALYRYLHARSTSYAGKVIDLREAIGGWLEYIPATFPHYTRHTLGHSDAVIGQLSHLIFYEEDELRAAIDLSAAEAYILLAASLLHDAGMVCSQAEKTEILDSVDWAQWMAASPARTEQLAALQAFRDGEEPGNRQLRDLLADYGLRQMIAEYVRRTHHTRVVPMLERDEAAFAGFAFADASLRSTIAAVCESHGLSAAELDDSQRFPDRRDVRDEEVNVRLMALLLRIADLLDVSPKRACPLMQSAAAPLPEESVAHWNQFERFRHRMTAPDRIELHAECENADEHRLVRDWCQWIVDEVAGARTLMAGTHRHAGWKPPLARMDGSDASISVTVAPGASYIPSDWTFELDPVAVIHRLVSDVSAAPLFFVRELIQNALDATRCRISDLAFEQTGTRVQDVREVDGELRARHPVRLTLSLQSRTDAISGGSEEVQELLIEDFGVGMSKQVIERYFLQVGRSFYTTPNFRARYEFAPTSRFGVGFLSVFGASDHVTVQTATGEDVASHSGGLSLTLTGPRGYILTEIGTRTKPGTRISVRLAEPLQQGVLTEMVSAFCRRVEVLVEVNDLGVETLIEPERAESFCWEKPVPDTDGHLVSVRSYPIQAPGIAGELYVPVYRYRSGAESWALTRWVEQAYPVAHPGDPLPALPSGAIFLNGLGAGRVGPFRPLRVRLDYRRPAPGLGMARANNRPIMADTEKDPGVIAALTEILDEHLSQSVLAQGEKGWEYLNQMVEAFPMKEYWLERDGVVPAQCEAGQALFSVRDLAQRPTLTTLQYLGEYAAVARQGRNFKTQTIPWQYIELSADEPLLVDWQLNRLSKEVVDHLLTGRTITQLHALPGQFLHIRWSLQEQRSASAPILSIGQRRFYLADLGNEKTIGFALHRSVLPDWNSVVLNSRSPLVQWACRLVNAASDPAQALTPGRLAPLGEMLQTPCTIHGYKYDRLRDYVDAWRTSDLDRELLPPNLAIARSSFDPPGFQKAQRRQRAIKVKPQAGSGAP
jgi:molecular chaperone HtpG